MELLTGFLIGILGSFHCIGMCGPIALSLPKSRNLLAARLFYNLGRIATYSMLGLLFGLLGERLEMFGLQRAISISLGIIIIITVITPSSYRIKLAQKSGFYTGINLLKTYFARLFKMHSYKSMFAIGLLNGLLPCGLVYVGITGAIAVGSQLNGMLFMAMFGLGTLPVMYGVSIAGSVINMNIRRRLNKLLPAFTLILAAVFILRGLNLGIPYLSPKLESKTKTEEIICQ
ncbi:MAG: sulfite exporter TauE/SafE family protein [Ignavibacteria bacterium]|nr:sulfite exporter TauE/SafE family protein [Ignavibacteria bacterium]